MIGEMIIVWVWECENPKAVAVIVHGANEHHGRYTWLVEKLVKDQFHVVMGDLPGQGEDPKHKGHIDSFDDYLTTIETWYKRAAKYELPIFLIGHSMGGLAVIQTMLKKNLDVCAVILSSPCLGLVNPPSKLKQYSSVVLNKLSPKLRFSSNLPKGSNTRCEQMRKFDETDPLSVKKVSVRWYQELVTAMEDSFKHVNHFPNVPLLLLQAGDDLIVDKKEGIRWFDGLPNHDKYYKEWPGLYHEVFNEPEKETVYRVTKSYMDLHLTE